MLTKLKLALLIAAPLAGATFTAAAQPGPGAPAGSRAGVIQKFDRNGDGKLDDAERADRKAALAAKRAELKKEMLARYDKNGDGKLDAAERAVMRDDLVTKRFQAMDKNGDGQLSLDEFKAGAGKAGLHHHGRHGHGPRDRTGTQL